MFFLSHELELRSVRYYLRFRNWPFLFLGGSLRFDNVFTPFQESRLIDVFGIASPVFTPIIELVRLSVFHQMPPFTAPGVIFELVQVSAGHVPDKYMIRQVNSESGYSVQFLSKCYLSTITAAPHLIVVCHAVTVSIFRSR